MTEQTITSPPPPPTEPPPSAQQRRTLGVPLVVGIAAATFVLGGVLGGLVGGVVGYAIGDDHGPDLQRSRMVPGGPQQLPGRDLPDQVPDGE